ncbi:hypothetical protein H310_04035 [Aphanomyces invadans]|uniref:C3H1-type domain-containing protein n=1 Tax=Aphanomyces invadans TaxID=157072 RepID=A0A024UGG8_9STRA|nr:hypothetical protein H310_04035 [Aphanomyces invadans]ETW04942.1 hypothetical protein H310_04035 [Aphanomyces invadans]|eukprot:XP_008866380.1 hypothetical protein H310_04035 [Aphanomyces invadans]
MQQPPPQLPLPPGRAPPLESYAHNALLHPHVAPPCRFFLSAKGCMRGSCCEFNHEGSPRQSSCSQQALPAAKVPQSRPLCRFYAKGECRNGTHCSFSHGADSNAMPSMNALDGPTSQAMTNSSDSNLLAALDADKVLTRDLSGPFFSVDVECVATGTGYNDRDVARIAVVDENESTVFDAYVKPDKPVVSYLTQLTGITAEHLSAALPLASVILDLKNVMPTNCVLVGQSVNKDVQWLGLQPGVDFRELFNVADLFRVPTTASYNYRYFSLRHVAKYLLGASIQEHDHDPVVDAVYAMKIFKRFRYLHENSGHRQAVLQTLLKTPRTPSFATRFPVIDGVLMSPPKEGSSI